MTVPAPQEAATSTVVIDVGLLGICVLLLLMLWLLDKVLKPMLNPPGMLPSVEVQRRIADLDERGIPVCMETLDPEHAHWYRSCFPWPFRWIFRKHIERELTRIYGGTSHEEPSPESEE